MVDVWIVHVYLPEPCDLVINARSAEQAESALVLDVFVKSQFGALKDADSDVGFPNWAKPRVIDFTKSVATSLSPTFAGRDATL